MIKNVAHLRSKPSKPSHARACRCRLGKVSPVWQNWVTTRVLIDKNPVVCRTGKLRRIIGYHPSYYEPKLTTNLDRCSKNHIFPWNSLLLLQLFCKQLEGIFHGYTSVINPRELLVEHKKTFANHELAVRASPVFSLCKACETFVRCIA